jgi:ATP-dependent RNA helicase DeaD
LSDDVLRALSDMGFEEPTPVQCEAIPLLMQNRDVIAQALTGTGKTAAFGVAIIERLSEPQRQPRAIVLAPTRELALQVAEEVHRIAKYRGLRVLPIYGGQSYEPQLRALQRGVDIVVATPGRLMDHMRQGKIDLSQIEVLVLDEADEMLNMGFQEDVEFVMAHLPEQRQTALFSATIPDPIRDLSRKYMRDPITVQLSHTADLTVPTVEQEYYVVPFRHKLEALLRLIEVKQAERSIVFAATRRMVDELAESLQARGHSAEALHGDMSQAMRERVMRGFRDGRIDILVATDVAARGIDVENVTHVFNFDIPPDPEYYVHRIGRTGRVGKTGQAITLVNPNEQREIRVIERETGAKIERRNIPTMTEVAEREREILAGRLERRLQEGNWGPFRDVIEGLTDDHDPIDVAAAALALLAGRQGSATTGGDQALDDINIREYEERPAYPARSGRFGSRGGRFSGGRPNYVPGRPPQRGGGEQGGDRRFRPSRSRPARG